MDYISSSRLAGCMTHWPSSSLGGWLITVRVSSPPLIVSFYHLCDGARSQEANIKATRDWFTSRQLEIINQIFSIARVAMINKDLHKLSDRNKCWMTLETDSFSWKWCCECVICKCNLWSVPMLVVTLTNELTCPMSSVSSTGDMIDTRAPTSPHHPHPHRHHLSFILATTGWMDQCWLRNCLHSVLSIFWYNFSIHSAPKITIFQLGVDWCSQQWTRGCKIPEKSAGKECTNAK